MSFDDHYREKGMEGQRKYPNEPMLRFLATLPKEGHVLELGCGTGANLWAIAKEGFKAYGIDSSTHALYELCRPFLDSHGVKALLVSGDFSSLNFPTMNDQNGTGAFDAVIDIISVQHAENKIWVFEEVLRVLKDGGKFFTYYLTSGADLFPGYPIFPMTSDDLGFLHDHFDVSMEKYTRQYPDGRVAMYTALTATKRAL